MRFAIAATVLAQALPVSSFLSRRSESSSEHFPPPPSNIAAVLQKVKASSPGIQQKFSKKNNDNPREPFPLGRGLLAEGRGVFGGGPLVNKLNNKTKIESSGARGTTSLFKNNVHGRSSSKPNECNPDTGLLACGIGMYCKRDDLSSLGGVCTSSTGTNEGGGTIETKGLYGYFYCDGVLSSSYDCDCSDWDGSMGTITCTEYPYSYYALDCPDVYFTIDQHYFKESSDQYGFESCIIFTKPYEQTFCNQLVVDESSLEVSCNIFLDDTKCNSCVLTNDNNCMDFDCTNVGMNSGNTCTSGFAFPIFTATCPSTPYEPCYMCNGRGVVYPDSLFVFGDGNYIGCGALDVAAKSGLYFDEESCASIMNGFQYCCVHLNYEPCYVCGSGDVDYPDANFYVEATGEIYGCDFIDWAGQSGNYIPNAEYCAYFSDAAKQSCCAVDPTSPPTRRPTRAPTSRPTRRPTARPTPSPVAPVPNPTPRPTSRPSSSAPVPSPTSRPAANPTAAPVPNPTPNPVASPTTAPVPNPTPSPTSMPTEMPTVQPTEAPVRQEEEPTTTTAIPTTAPTQEPTMEDASEETGIPTAAPTAEATEDHVIPIRTRPPSGPTTRAPSSSPAPSAEVSSDSTSSPTRSSGATTRFLPQLALVVCAVVGAMLTAQI